ncbi:hypothetical protein T439DRAFT_358156 [Meredithblackwellia eburnea MCA 4105]
MDSWKDGVTTAISMSPLQPNLTNGVFELEGPLIAPEPKFMDTTIKNHASRSKEADMPPELPVTTEVPSHILTDNEAIKIDEYLSYGKTYTMIIHFGQEFRTRTWPPNTDSVDFVSPGDLTREPRHQLVFADVFGENFFLRNIPLPGYRTPVGPEIWIWNYAQIAFEHVLRTFSGEDEDKHSEKWTLRTRLVDVPIASNTEIQEFAETGLVPRRRSVLFRYVSTTCQTLSLKFMDPEYTIQPIGRMEIQFIQKVTFQESWLLVGRSDFWMGVTGLDSNDKVGGKNLTCSIKFGYGFWRMKSATTTSPEYLEAYRTRWQVHIDGENIELASFILDFVLKENGEPVVKWEDLPIRHPELAPFVTRELGSEVGHEGRARVFRAGAARYQRRGAEVLV